MTEKEKSLYEQITSGKQVEVRRSPIKTLAVSPVSKQEVVETIAKEGLIVKANTLDEIPDTYIIDAQHHVIKNMREDINKYLDDVRRSDELVKQFYAAARKANISISRDSSGKIQLEWVGFAVDQEKKEKEKAS